MCIPFIATVLHVYLKRKMTYIKLGCVVLALVCYLSFHFSVCNVHVCMYNVYIHSYVHVIAHCTVH